MRRVFWSSLFFISLSSLGFAQTNTKLPQLFPGLFIKEPYLHPDDVEGCAPYAINVAMALAQRRFIVVAPQQLTFLRSKLNRVTRFYLLSREPRKGEKNVRMFASDVVSKKVYSAFYNSTSRSGRAVLKSFDSNSPSNLTLKLADINQGEEVVIQLTNNSPELLLLEQ